jgi:hypothetical protein
MPFKDCSGASPTIPVGRCRQMPKNHEKPSITLPFKHNNKNMRGVLRFNLPRATTGGRIMSF